MSLKEQMIADAALFTSVDDFGEEVTWTPAGGSALAEPVAIQFHFGSIILSGQVVAVETEATLLVAVADIPDPSAGASFVRGDGKGWTVKQSDVRGSDGVFWKLAAHLNPRPTLRF